MKTNKNNIKIIRFMIISRKANFLQVNKDLKNIPKEQLPPDFYGDDTKGGFWGSNLLTKK